jgi:hypothetical protein
MDELGIIAFDFEATGECRFDFEVRSIRAIVLKANYLHTDYNCCLNESMETQSLWI